MSAGSWFRAMAAVTFTAATTVVGSATADAQQLARITGQIVDARTQRPLAGAQVYIEGSGLGVITGQDGRYILSNVPPGEVILRVQMIGTGTESRTMTVAGGQTATADFQLSERAISMDEIIVTGAAGATERRRIGNTIATINASELMERTPISSLDELLKGRASGVHTIPTSGQVGTGAIFRIRGQVSVSQTNSPLVYIDGVRVDNSKDSGPGLGGQGLSRLADLTPADFDRVEVIKGAAATTLYGTEASAGVIQIFTKKGVQGQTRWSFQTEQGVERVPEDVFEGDLYPEFVGPTGLRARNPREIVETGHHQSYQLSVGGGGEGVRYYLSGGFVRQEGSIQPDRNHLRQVTTRANITAVPSPKITLNWNTGYTNSKLRIPDGDNGLYGYVSAVHLAVPYTATEDRPWGESFNALSSNRMVENFQSVHHIVTGLTVDFQPIEALRNSMTVGLDVVDEESTKLFPFGFTGSGNQKGLRSNANRTNALVSVDARSVFAHRFSESLTSETAFGGQLNHGSNNRVFAQGEEFPAPGVSTVGAGARTTGTETRVTEVNAGLFFQQTIGIADRLFLTGGVRLDGNSAFGDEFVSQTYPKASLAYTISDESFWPTDLIGSLKLRVAWGTSGLAPAQFAADRTYLAVSALEGLPAVTPGNLGDPNLAPERSTELEVGFDAGLLGDRLGLEVTYYRQKTEDALVPAQFPPSEGFRTVQLKNIGELQNRGIEASVRALWLQRENFSFETNLQLATQDNEVTDMGGAAPIRRGFNQQVREGYPASGFWRRNIVSWDPVARRHTTTDTLEYIGSDKPTFFGSLSAEMTLFRNVVVSGLADWATGHVHENATRGFRIQFLTGDEYLRLVERPNGARTPAADSLLNYVAALGSTSAYIEDADFLKVRELAITYLLPDSWLARFGLGGSSIRVAGRNLWTFTKYTGIDPETSWDGTDGFNNGSEFFTVPPARRFSIAFRTNF